MVFIRRPPRKGDGITAAVGDDPSLTVPSEHGDVADELVVDRDERPLAAALRWSVDDQIVGRQACQGSPDGLEVVAPATGGRDELNNLA